MQAVTDKIYKHNEPFLENIVKLKYKLISKNIYNFYRGTCHLYYEDLAKSKNIPFSPLTWICGDLHLENFGSFRGDNRLVYFDLNDFDEAILAPTTWELTRFITSIFIAFEAMQIEEAKALNMAKLFLKTYSLTLAKGKPKYLEPQTSKGIVCNFLSAANQRKNKRLLIKKTIKINGKRQIRKSTKHIPIDKTLKKQLKAHIADWIENHHDSLYNYEVVDVVFRIAGLGSMGLKRYLFLLKSTNVKEKYLLVDMKQSKDSSLEKHLAITQPAWDSHATRIIEIQKRMQNVPPALLSTLMFNGDHYVIQEMQSAKDSIKLNLVKDRYRDIYQVIDDMAMLTASSHLRSSGRQKSASADELILFGESDKWQQMVLDYSFNYVQKVKKDFLEFQNRTLGS